MFPDEVRRRFSAATYDCRSDTAPADPIRVVVKQNLGYADFSNGTGYRIGVDCCVVFYLFLLVSLAY